MIQKYKDTIKTTDDIGRLVVDAKEKFLSGIMIQNRKYYLVITISAEPADKKKIDNKFFQIVLKDHKPITQAIHNQTLKRLEEAAETLTSQIKNLGVTLVKQNKDQLLHFLYRQMNPGRADVVPAGIYNSARTLRSQIILNACKNDYDSVYLDGLFHRAINLYIRPEQLNTVMMMDLMARITPDADLTMAVIPWRPGGNAA